MHGEEVCRRYMRIAGDKGREEGCSRPSDAEVGRRLGSWTGAKGKRVKI